MVKVQLMVKVNFRKKLVAITITICLLFSSALMLIEGFVFAYYDEVNNTAISTEAYDVDEYNGYTISGIMNDVTNDNIYNSEQSNQNEISESNGSDLVNVIFNPTGGALPYGHSTRTVARGGALGPEMPSSPLRSGFIFMRWVSGSPESTDTENAFTTATIVNPTGDTMNVYALWAYGVEFESNHPLVSLNRSGNANQADSFVQRNVPAIPSPHMSINDADGIVWPNDPFVPPGHTFLGWYNVPIPINTTTLPAGAERFDNKTPINRNFVLHGRWEALDTYYTVTFNPGAGSVAADHQNTRQAIPGKSVSTSWVSGFMNTEKTWPQSAPLVEPPPGMVLSGWFTEPNGGGNFFAAPGRAGVNTNPWLNIVNHHEHANFTNLAEGQTIGGQSFGLVNGNMTVHAHYVYRVVFVPGAGAANPGAPFNNYRVRDITQSGGTVGANGEWQIRTAPGATANGRPSGAVYSGMPPIPESAPSTELIYKWYFMGWFTEPPPPQGWTVTRQLVCNDPSCTDYVLVCWHITMPTLTPEQENSRFDANTVVTESMTVFGYWVRVLRGGDGDGYGNAPDWEIRFFAEGGTWPTQAVNNHPQGGGFRNPGYLPAGTGVWRGEHVFRSVEGATSLGVANRPTFPTLDGFVFMGWYTEPNGAGELFEGNNPFPVEIELEVFAHWLPFFTVTFSPNGGNMGAETVNVNANNYSGPRRIAQGHTFEDMDSLWRANNNFGVTMGIFNNGFRGNHYRGDSPAPASFGVNRDGFTFIGWNSQSDGNGTPFNIRSNVPTPSINDATPVTRDITIYAQWAAQVTFNSNRSSTSVSGADATMTSSVVVGRNFVNNQQNVNNPFAFEDRFPSQENDGGGYVAWPELNLSGYVFTGFNTEQNGSGEWFSRSTVVEGPITVYAQWQRIYGNIVFDSGFAPQWVIEQENRSRNSAAWPVVLGNNEFPPDPYWTGHEFFGWNRNMFGTGHTYSYSTSIEGPRVLYAVWLIPVRFDPNGGNLPSGQYPSVQVQGGNALLQMHPRNADERHNWDFSHWSDTVNGSSGEFSRYTPITSTITLYAQWQANVKFLLDGGNISGSTATPARTIPEGGTVGTSNMPDNPHIPMLDGHVFSHWEYYNGNGGGTGVEFLHSRIINTGHITVIAIFTPIDDGYGNGCDCGDCDDDGNDGNGYVCNNNNDDGSDDHNDNDDATENKTGAEPDNKQLPRTGIESNVALWSVLFILTIIIAATIIVPKLKRNKRDSE